MLLIPKKQTIFMNMLLVFFEAKFEIPEDPIPVKSEPLEDMCLISISHDDYTIIQELTEDSVNEDFLQGIIPQQFMRRKKH